MGARRARGGHRGRKHLFLITLAGYMLATMATAFSTGWSSCAVCRFGTGVGLWCTGPGFLYRVRDATSQTLRGRRSFFSSAAASSAHLTVRDVFPQEMRAMAMAIFFAVGAARVMVAAAIAWRYGANAVRRSLEDMALPRTG